MTSSQPDPGLRRDDKRPLTPPAVRARKGAAEPLVCLTAYTAPVARALDAHADVLLVGDTVGMVIYGMDSTLPVDLHTMVRHGQAVVRAAERAMVVVDLPFGTYQESPEQAFRSASRVLRKTGCAAVKLEGGAEMAPAVAFLTKRGVPVMGHIGLMPQSVATMGGYKVQGRDEAGAARLLDDARALAGAGALAIVLEGVPEPVARAITEGVKVPTIGIGASAACDGQILVTDDMLGLIPGRAPKFVKRYASLYQDIEAAAQAYAADVRARRFPGDAQTY